MRCPSVKARSSPETLNVRATSEVVSSPLSVPVGAMHQDAHTVGLVPSEFTRAISQRSEAFAEAFDSSARMFATAIPVSVNACSCLREPVHDRAASGVGQLQRCRPARRRVPHVGLHTRAPSSSTPPDPPMPSPRRRPCRSGTASSLAMCTHRCHRHLAVSRTALIHPGRSVVASSRSSTRR